VGGLDVPDVAAKFSGMNVLVYTSLWPNAERPNFAVFVQHRAAALARQPGVRARVVAPIPYFPNQLQFSFVPGHWLRDSRLPARETIAGLDTFHPRHLVTPKLGMSFYARWMASGTEALVRRLHAEQAIDVIDAHYAYPDGAAAVRLGERLGVPVIVTARGTDINLFSRMPLIRPRIRRALKRAVGVIAVSDALKMRMIELGIEAEKIAVIRNGIDGDLFYRRDRAAARRALGLDPAARIALTVSALAPVKGVARLIEAMGLMPDERAALYVIGDGPEKASLQTRIVSLGLSDRVFLLGARPQRELAEWYAAADVFCLASHREGCPNVVIESLACGLPVVAPDVGGITELVLAGRDGRIVAEPTARAFAIEIQQAFEIEWDAEAIAARGGARSWRDVGSDVLRYFVERGVSRSAAN
jgi:glycosyltransferase involved in cell wall biosynthesis